jgi:enolase
MKIKEVSASKINDSRKEKTILVSIKTSNGKMFSASSPNGKSVGKYATKIYKKSLEEDINTIKKFSDYFSEEINCLDDLEKIEEILSGHVGANTLFAFESSILKSLAVEKKKQIWQLINPKAKKFPRFVGNCIGGGKHSFTEKKPDFQEFLLIPKTKTIKNAFGSNKKSKKEIGILLEKADENFKNKKNDEDAWMTPLNEKEVLEILRNLKIPLGLDIAASSFYTRKKYNYKNPLIKRDNDEQLEYVSNLIKNFDLFYIEDPFEENDFESFTKLLKKFPDKLIVGDDLTVTNYERTEKAIKEKSINAIIIKPNQCGSLLNVKKVCDLAKKNNIKLVFSHRSGETKESILSDLAFGFQADFFKVGITGNEREAKIKRLIEIEKSLDRKS